MAAEIFVSQTPGWPNCSLLDNQKWTPLVFVHNIFALFCNYQITAFYLIVCRLVMCTDSLERQKVCLLHYKVLTFNTSNEYQNCFLVPGMILHRNRVHNCNDCIKISCGFFIQHFVIVQFGSMQKNAHLGDKSQPVLKIRKTYYILEGLCYVFYTFNILPSIFHDIVSTGLQYVI